MKANDRAGIGLLSLAASLLTVAGCAKKTDDSSCWSCPPMVTEIRDSEGKVTDTLAAWQENRIQIIGSNFVDEDCTAAGVETRCQAKITLTDGSNKSIKGLSGIDPVTISNIKRAPGKLEATIDAMPAQMKSVCLQVVNPSWTEPVIAEQPSACKLLAVQPRALRPVLTRAGFPVGTVSDGIIDVDFRQYDYKSQDGPAGSLNPTYVLFRSGATKRLQSINLTVETNNTLRIDAQTQKTGVISKIRDEVSLSAVAILHTDQERFANFTDDMYMNTPRIFTFETPKLFSGYFLPDGKGAPAGVYNFPDTVAGINTASALSSARVGDRYYLMGMIDNKLKYWSATDVTQIFKSLPIEHPSMAMVNWLGVADLSGDGQRAFIWRSTSNMLGMIPITPASLGSSQSLSLSGAPPTGLLALADVDGDRKADLIRASAKSIFIRRNQGNLTFGSEELLKDLAPETGFNFTPEAITTGDVDLDGKIDVILADKDGVTVIFNR